MCGIAGIAWTRIARERHHELIRGMLAPIAHRGPDEAGCLLDKDVALGSVRLSIIDVSHGHQPMSAGDKQRYWLVYNGEIYNYVELRAELRALGHAFADDSDTRVALHALIEWGTQALERFNGQFALAFYDRQEDSLLLARDPLGERPLYYTQAANAFAFASEIKSLLVLPGVSADLDAEALLEGYLTWVSPQDRSCFREIHSLEPGQFARIHKRGGLSVGRYYRLPVGTIDVGLGYEEASSACCATLREAIRLRLRSDVPVGVYLSGGLDSSITAATVVACATEEVRTFSVEFDDPAFDEAEYQALLAKEIGTTHSSVRIATSTIVRLFPEMLWHAETIQFRTAAVPLLALARHVHEEGFKVVITGEGADEAFLGYNLFKELLFRGSYDSFPDDHARLNALQQLYPYLNHFRGAQAASVLRFYHSHKTEKTPGLFSHQVRFANSEFGARLLATDAGRASSLDALAGFAGKLRAAYPEFDKLTPMERAQIIEYRTLLAGYLLSSQGDRASMASAVETRSPFLDTQTVDAALRMPIDYRLRAGRNEKHILKKAFAERIPRSILERPKQPYRAPDAVAFLQAPKDETWVADVLSERALRDTGVIDMTTAARFLQMIRSKPPDAISARENQAFMLLMSTSLLYRQFIAEEHLPTRRFELPSLAVIDLGATPP